MAHNTYRVLKKQVKTKRTIHSSSCMEMRMEDGLTFANMDENTKTICPVVMMTTILQSQLDFLFDSDQPPLMDFVQLNQDFFAFAVSGEMTFGEECYDPNIPKWPAVVKHCLVSARDTSFRFESSLYLANGSEATSTNKTTHVIVAKDSRKPSPFPDWWRQKYGSFLYRLPPTRFPDVVRPEQLICEGVLTKPYSITVPRRSMDWYNHTNFSSYLQFSLDALDYHILKIMSKPGSKKQRLLLKQSMYTHKGESRVGDILSVALWDDVTMPGWICFDISKSGKVIYVARMSFYNFPSEQSKL